MAAVRTTGEVLRNRLAIAALMVILRDLPDADLLDHRDRLQAAQPGDHGPADGVLRARGHRPS